MNNCNLKKNDILKLDIEGAAIDVLDKAFDDNIYPDQIAAEFERPPGLINTILFLKKIYFLIKKMKKKGYILYRTREIDLGCQIEILAKMTTVKNFK